MPLCYSGPKKYPLLPLMSSNGMCSVLLLHGVLQKQNYSLSRHTQVKGEPYMPQVDLL